MVALVVVGATRAIAAPAAPAVPAVPAATSSDVQARDLFQARRYPEALAIYGRLYAETRHPTYEKYLGAVTR